MPVHTVNCFNSDSSDSRTLPHSSAVQSSSFLTKSKCLNFMAVVRRGLRACLCDFRSSSLLRLCEMVIRLTCVPFASKPACIYMHEHDEERVAMCFIT